MSPSPTELRVESQPLARALLRRAREQVVEARRRCPGCAAPADGEPDALRVFRCSSCGIEFRPPERMPVRSARVHRDPKPSWLPESSGDATLGPTATAAILAFVGIVVVGNYISTDAGRRDDAARARQLAEQAARWKPKRATGPAPARGPDRELALAVERSQQRVDGRVQASGWLSNTGAAAADEPRVFAACTPPERREFTTSDATIACRHLAPGQRCAWVLDAMVPDDCGPIELRARDHGVAPLDKLTVERSFPATGECRESGCELSFEPGTGELRIDLARAPALKFPWLSLTSLDAQGRVLDVSVTWPGELREADGVVELTLPEREQGSVASWRVRLEGVKLD